MKEELIESLINITKENLNAAVGFEKCAIQDLQKKPNANKWSVLECLEHLNIYASFYHPEIGNRLNNAKKSTSNHHLKSTWLGKKFVAMMQIDKSTEQVLPKVMNSPKSANPSLVKSDIDINTLHQFIQDQKQLLTILDHCRNVNLNEVKTNISISKLIKLRLHDTLKVLVYHNERHIWQAKMVLGSSE